jgi:hypothetical protein
MESNSDSNAILNVIDFLVTDSLTNDESLKQVQERGRQLSKQRATDVHYWYYLSLDSDLYKEILREEMSRNKGEVSSLIRHKEAIPLCPVSPNTIQSCAFHIGRLMTEDNFRYRVGFHSDYYKSADEEEADHYILSLGSDLNNVIRTISRIDNVAICGGFPFRCIYQQLRETTWNWNSSFLINIGELECSYNTRKFDIDIFIYQDKSGNGDGDGDKDKGMDVNIERTLKEINEVLGVSKWYSTDNAIGCIYRGISFQVIKRVYSSMEEILTGFDIDSSSVAYKNERFYYLKRFYRSINKGYNVIVPARQSKSYKYRLGKYMERGISIKVPGDIHTNLTNKDISRYLSNVAQTGKNISDYGNVIDDYIDNKQGYAKYILYKLRNIFEGLFIPSNTDKLFSNTDKWITENPGTQVSGTFHPTNKDFLKFLSDSSNRYNIKKEEEEDEDEDRDKGKEESDSGELCSSESESESD